MSCPMSELLSLFQKNGVAKPVKKGELLYLGEEDRIFYSGPLNLFSVEKSGVRHFISRCQGPLFFSLPLYGMSEEAQTIYEMKKEQLTSLLQKPLFAEFQAALQDWVDTLSLSLTQPFPEGDSLCMLPGKISSVEAEQVIACRKKTIETWIQVVEGELAIYGDETLRLTLASGYFPLSPSLWLKSLNNCKAKVITTLSLIEENQWLRGIEQYQAILKQILSRKLEEIEKDEKQLLEDRDVEQELNLRNAIEQMQSIFQHEKIQQKTHNALEVAFLKIGEEMKINFHFPSKIWRLSRLEEMIDAICEASKIRKRIVRLRQDWWLNNGGHFLAFFKEEPVALINRPSLRYQMHNDSKKVQINRSLAKEIHPVAYQFYTPLPSEVISGGSIGAFLVSHYKNLLFFTLLFSAAAAIIAFFPSLATKLLFAYAIPESSRSLILYLTAGLFCAAFGYAFFYVLRSYCFLKFEGLASHLSDTGIWDRLLKLPPSFFRRFSAGNLLYRASGMQDIRALITGNTVSIVLSGIFSLFYFFLMFFFSPLLAVVSFLITLVSFIMVIFLAYKKTTILRKSLELQGRFRSLIIQTISGVGKLRVANAEKSAFSHCANTFTHFKLLQLKTQNIENIVAIFSAFFPLLSMWAIYALVLEKIGARGLSLPNFLAFNMAFGAYSAGIYPLNAILIKLATIFPLWERTEVILKEPQEEEESRSDPGKLSGALFVDSVVFGYDPSRPPIINRVSLQVKPHEMIGIVGPSGSGKSTLLRLKLGFEKPQSGGVYYDGKDLASLDPRSVRRQIGTVMQGVGLLAGNIYENLISGGSYTKEQVKTALELSGFDKDLEDLPMGIMTYIPMNGATLSGGQKQRLLLTRALLVNPCLLIFDEATSALDNTSQEAITRNIETLNTTRILVAQRLSTIKRADRIYVIQNGIISQVGTFEELAKAPGLFAEMLRRQKV